MNIVVICIDRPDGWKHQHQGQINDRIPSAIQEVQTNEATSRIGEPRDLIANQEEFLQVRELPQPVWEHLYPVKGDVQRSEALDVEELVGQILEPVIGDVEDLEGSEAREMPGKRRELVI